MTAYWVARALVINPGEYKKYTDEVPDIVGKWGGRILARGGRFEILEGPDTFHRFVVIEFPTLEAARNCHRSAEYQAAAAHRLGGAGRVEIIIVEGIAPTA